MALENSNNREDYDITGSPTKGPFQYRWKIFTENELNVTKRQTSGQEVQLNYPADYSVTGAGQEAGGEILLTADALVGERITILRNIDDTQPQRYAELGKFPSVSHENALDRRTMVSQQQGEELNRSLKVAVTDNIAPVLPPAVANAVIAIWNAQADGLLIGPQADEISNAQGYAEQAQTEADRAKTEADRAASMFTTPRTWTGGLQNYTPLDLTIAGGVVNWNGITHPVANLTLTENITLNKLQMAITPYITVTDAFVVLRVGNNANFTIAFDATYVGGAVAIPQPVSNGRTVYIFHWESSTEQALFMSAYRDS